MAIEKENKYCDNWSRQERIPGKGDVSACESVRSPRKAINAITGSHAMEIAKETERPLLTTENWGLISNAIYKYFNTGCRITKSPGYGDIDAMSNVVAEKIGLIDPLIEMHSSSVCPNCNSVCCIDKFGRYDFDDLLYVCSMGVKPMSHGYDSIRDETARCRFLSANGCVEKRALRPFRCNWYFCEPLIDRLNSGSQRHYRHLSALLSEVIALRRELVDRLYGLFIMSSAR
ncbi:MAG: hypothetical protein HQK89_10645 [Nitrospirae bacterium]|nr:hypothetical protein [Nitrospirota bacterium]